MSDDTNEDVRVRTRTRSRKTEEPDTTPASDEKASDEKASDEKDAGGDGRTSRRRRRGGRGRGRRGRGRGGGGSQREATGDDTSGGDEDIPQGGTRLAAKRQQQGRARRARRTRDRTGGMPEEMRRAIVEGPPRSMLVTTRDDRTQIAVLEDRTVVEHYVTRKADVSYVGNIYKARVQNVLPGMEAAFLDIGKGRNGVLYAGEVAYDELDLEDGTDHRIEEALKVGQLIPVQVTKDPMGTKGARLTMQLSLAGRYMVLAPDGQLFGISRKLSDEERDRLRKILKRIKPEGVGVIVRTAAAEATEEQLQEDLDRLTKKWEIVRGRLEDAKALEPVYEEPDLVVRVIRDHFGPEFVRLVVDDADVHAKVKDYLEEVMPEALDKLELYERKVDGSDEDEREPLFEAYHVSEQLRKALDRKVWLPSGGYLIIEKTEALTVVDVNTGKFTGSTNLEETVLKTNLEAAEEIVRQLRLRDIGGMIIIDFIDMLLKANQDQVIRTLKRELLRDRTKTRVSEISKLGLVQMTRKNVSQGLLEVFSEKCPECDGRGVKLTMEV